MLDDLLEDDWIQQNIDVSQEDLDDLTQYREAIEQLNHVKKTYSIQEAVAYANKMNQTELYQKHMDVNTNMEALKGWDDFKQWYIDLDSKFMAAAEKALRKLGNLVKLESVRAKRIDTLMERVDWSRVSKIGITGRLAKLLQEDMAIMVTADMVDRLLLNDLIPDIDFALSVVDKVEYFNPESAKNVKDTAIRLLKSTKMENEPIYKLAKNIILTDVVDIKDSDRAILKSKQGYFVPSSFHKSSMNGIFVSYAKKTLRFQYKVLKLNSDKDIALPSNLTVSLLKKVHERYRNYKEVIEDGLDRHEDLIGKLSRPTKLIRTIKEEHADASAEILDDVFRALLDFSYDRVRFSNEIVALQRKFINASLSNIPSDFNKKEGEDGDKVKKVGILNRGSNIDKKAER